MTPRTKAISITILATLLGLLLAADAPLGRLVWPAHPVDAEDEPTQAQLAGFIAVYAWQCVAFGVGVAFLAMGYPRVARLAGTPGLARAAHLAIAWTLVNWVPHVNLHMHFGEDPAGLLAIEWAFHATLVIAGGVLMAFFLRVTRARAVAEAKTTATPPAPDAAT